MKRLTYTFVALLVLAADLANAAPVPVRTASPDEAASAAASRRYVAQEKIKSLLFGVNKLPKGCFYEVVDPSQEYTTPGNLAITCGDKTFTACDAQGVSCK